MILKDNITGEILSINDYIDCLREAKSRLKFHNSVFNYYRGKHYSENAELVISDNEIIIRRKA